MVSRFQELATQRASESGSRFAKLATKNKPKEDTRDLGEKAKAAAISYGAGVGGGAGGTAEDIIRMLEPAKTISPGIGALSNLSQVMELKSTPELTESLTKEMGGQEPQNSLERILQQSGEFGGMEGLIGTAVGGPVGGGLGLAHGSASGAFYGGLKEMGMDDKWALGATTLLTLSPIAAEKFIAKFKTGSSIKKALKEVKKEVPEASKAVVQTEQELAKFPSGLTKSKAVDNPHAKKALLTPEKQKIALKAIDEEAAKLARTKVEKHVPGVKRIEEGFDFEQHFEKGFGEIKKAVKAANPEVDLTDISEYLKQARKDLPQLPKELYTSEQKKILSEIRTLRNQPQGRMNNLFELFRLNNKKRSLIYEKRFLTGKQKDYVDFLSGLNDSIVKSFERTLPEDSEWLRSFKDLNAAYSQYMKSLQTLNKLESILGERANPALFSKLAINPKMQRQLSLSMGQEGAAEIIQLAKDVKAAREAIKNIPVKKISEMNKIYPLGLVIPGVKIPAGMALLKTVAEVGRRAYGWYLTTPARINALDQAVKAASIGDVQAYKRATDVLKAEMPKQIGYQEKKLIEYKPES